MQTLIRAGRGWAEARARRCIAHMMIWTRWDPTGNGWTSRPCWVVNSPSHLVYTRKQLKWIPTILRSSEKLLLMNRIGKCHKACWMTFGLYDRDVKWNLCEIKCTACPQVLYSSIHNPLLRLTRIPLFSGVHLMYKMCLHHTLSFHMFWTFFTGEGTDCTRSAFVGLAWQEKL